MKHRLLRGNMILQVNEGIDGDDYIKLELKVTKVVVTIALQC